MGVKEKGTRIFIISIVGAFILSSLGFSALVIWSLTHDDSQNDSQTSDIQKQLQDQQCSIQIPVTGKKAEAVPKVSTVSADVTRLVKKDLKVGTGKAAQNGDCLVVKYNGVLAKNGKKFDGDFDTSNAIQFTLGKQQVIKGWDEGLGGMKVGGVRELIIPSDKAYGKQSSTKIPANSDLIFVVQLLDIK